MNVERFWSKVQMLPCGGCWIWTASTTDQGYGHFYIGKVNGVKRTKAVHRIAYESEVGPVPNGMTLDHLCRNRACVNPAHLEPVSRGENVLRGQSPSAKAARKTECVRGHSLTGDNLYIRPDGGGRQCRTCNRERKLNKLRGHR